jgi:DNA-binding PadR family transcriptional regulator
MSAMPYAGSSGHSGGASSEARAMREDATGITGARQKQVYEMVSSAASTGLTDREVQDALRIGHGASSAALTRLQKTGFLTRLKEQRNGNEIYVLPAHVGDREVAHYRPNTTSAQLRESNERLTETLNRVRALLRVTQKAGDVVLSVTDLENALYQEGTDVE